MVFVAQKCTICFLVMVGRCHVSRPKRVMIGEVVQASSVEKLDRCRWQLTSYFEVPSDQVCVLSFVAPWMVWYHVLAQTPRKNTFSDDVWTKMLAELGASKIRESSKACLNIPRWIQMVRKSMDLVLESDNSRGWELPVHAPPGLEGRFHPNVTQAQPSRSARRE